MSANGHDGDTNDRFILFENLLKLRLATPELRNFCLMLIKSGLNVSELNSMLNYNNKLGLATDELDRKLEKLQTILSVFVKISEFVVKSFKKQSNLTVQIPQHLSPKNLLEKISENVGAEKSYDHKKFSIIKYNEKMLKWVGNRRGAHPSAMSPRGVTTIAELSDSL